MGHTLSEDPSSNISRTTRWYILKPSSKITITVALQPFAYKLLPKSTFSRHKTSANLHTETGRHDI